MKEKKKKKMVNYLKLRFITYENKSTSKTLITSCCLVLSPLFLPYWPIMNGVIPVKRANKTTEIIERY